MALGFVFTGGMAIEPSGLDLYQKYPVMRAWYEQVGELTGLTRDELLTESFLQTFRELGSSAPARCRPIATVRRVALCLGAVDILAEMEILPEVVGGYSLGWMVAACVAGSVSRADLLEYLLRWTRLPLTPDGEPQRGVALAMLPADLDLDRLAAELPENVHLAADLGQLEDGRTRTAMFSGYLADLERFAANAPEGAVIKPTGALGGPHNPLQRFLVELTEPLVDEISFTDPKTALVSSLDGRTLTSAGEVREEFLANLIKPVYQRHMSAGLLRHGVRFGMVLGADTPGSALKYPFPTVQICAPDDVVQAITAMLDYQVAPAARPF